MSDSPAPSIDTNNDEPDLGYQVNLHAFSGPLDLLLHLVRKAEVAITDIPISQIADQFIAAIAGWEEADLDLAGDFILMAATLLELKARSIAPLHEDDENEDGEEDAIDPRSDLVRQLLAFRKTKDAVHWLEDLQAQRRHLHSRCFVEHIPEDPDQVDAIDLDNADPYLLFSAWEKVLQSIAGSRERVILYDDVPIEERVRKLEQLMSSSQEAQLEWLLQRESGPLGRVGIIVATLEALRQHIIEASQHQQYGPVHLHYLEPEQRSWKPLQTDEDEETAAPRRRRRPPLFTWQRADAGLSESDSDPTLLNEDEALVESDEQRFLRELNESCAIDSLLERVRNLDDHLHAHLLEQNIPLGKDEAHLTCQDS